MRRALIRILTALLLFLLAVAAGYLLSSSIGGKILRGEANRQLAKLMRGPVTIGQLHLRLGLGIEIEGDNVAAYPGPHGPGLSAPHVSATVDLLSLLLGRPRLRRLELDDAHMRVERFSRESLEGPAGLESWSPPPLAKLSQWAQERREKEREEEEREGRGDLEGYLSLLNAIEQTTRVLLETLHLADLVELRNGSVTFIDAATSHNGALSFRLEGIEAALSRHWLSGEAELDWRALLEDDRSRQTRIEAQGRRQGDGRLQMSLTATELELEAVEPYLSLRGRPISLSGRLSGTVAFDTTEPGHCDLELDWSLDDLATEFPLTLGRLDLYSAASRLRARLELRPDRLRLAQAELSGSQMKLELSGVVERPLRDTSIARISAALRGVGPAEVERIVEALPEKNLEFLSRLLERIESGRIERLGGSGSARLSGWRRLLEGTVAALPEGFVMGAEVSDLSLALGGGGRVSDLGAAVEWSGDRLEVRNGGGRWNGERLPAVNITLDGVSKVLAGWRERRTMEPAAESLAGLATLGDLLGGDRKQVTPPALPEVRITIDALRHPALAQPLTHTSVTFEPIEQGLQASVTEGRWGSSPVRGEAVYLREPEQSLSLALEVSSPQQQTESENAPAGLSQGKWAAGSFEVSPPEPQALPFSVLSGHFELARDTLLLSKVEAELTPSGVLEADGSFDLEKREEVPVEVTLRLVESEIDPVGGLLDLPKLLVSGRLNLRARVSGTLHRGVPPISSLTGEVAIAARDGSIRRELPVVVAMAQATEGFNPFSENQSLHFEAVETTLLLRCGRVATDDFKMEGPIRAFASGWADLGRPSQEIDAVIGVFLFRQAGQVLDYVPLVNILVPGSDKGLVGAYFRLQGQWNAPRVKVLPMKSLAEDLPDLLKAPLKVIQSILKPKQPEAKRWIGPCPALPEEVREEVQ